MTTSDSSPRAPWYRSPWPMLALAAVAVAALVIGLALRFLADPRPVEAVAELRQCALVFGMAAFIVSGYATMTTALPLPRFGRGLLLRLFPRLDQQPPPVTAAAARWTPVARTLAFVAWGGGALWYLVAGIGWLIARLI